MNIGSFSFNSASTLIVAELSANHNQDFDIAVKTIEAAKAAGADAIKLQTYTADTMTINCDNGYFKINKGTVWDGQTLYDLYLKAYTPWEWHPKLKEIAEKNNLLFFSTPFDRSAVDFLVDLEVPAFKIASFEITDIDLIAYIASKRKPVILATGIADLEDISLAVETCRKSGNNDVILLKCTSEYPAPLESMNLLTIPDMIDRFKVIAGLSDHSIGSTAAVVSVALGARIVEKHFILDRKLGGPDATFSMEPKEFRQLVDSVREAEKIKGVKGYALTEATKRNREFARSLFIVKDITKGEKFSRDNVKAIRPGYGLLPKFSDRVYGRVAKKDLKRGTPLSWDLIE